MPELPEVETICRGLSREVVSKKINKISIKKRNLVKNSQSFFRKVLIGNSFVKIDRIGKLLIFVLKKSDQSEKQYLLIHLKMTGQLVYCDPEKFVVGGHVNSSEEEVQFIKKDRENFCQPGKYTHIIFKFQDGSSLFFNDLRQFGYLKIVSDDELQDIKSKYGIEPEQPNFTFVNFKKALGVRRANIKATLLNQAIISGLGNIYVDEALFSAKIHPQRLVNSLTGQEQKLLFPSIKRIIRLAIKYNGTTFSDFVDCEGQKGNFKQKLKVYGQQNKKCKQCNEKIQKIKVAGRGTHFCIKCQR